MEKKDLQEEIQELIEDLLKTNTKDFRIVNSVKRLLRDRGYDTKNIDFIRNTVRRVKRDYLSHCLFDDAKKLSDEQWLLCIEDFIENKFKESEIKELHSEVKKLLKAFE
jgi:hypothetical protein